MIKNRDEQITSLSAFLETPSSRWAFGNSILYQMCSDNPLHNDVNVIAGKIWIIGRTYSAAIERRRINTDFDGDFYYEIVAPKLMEIGPELDERILKINQHSVLTEQNLDLVLTTHKFLMDTFFEITNLEKRSLASKYLHFHCPSMFFIYDSFATINSKKRVKLDKEKAALHYSCNGDKEYTDFCVRMLELRDFVNAFSDKMLTPRELDNLVLNA